MTTRTVSFPDEMAEQLEGEAQRRGTTVSEVIQGAVAAHLGRTSGEAKPPSWIGLVDDPSAPRARDLDEILAREWANGLQRDRR